MTPVLSPATGGLPIEAPSVRRHRLAAPGGGGAIWPAR